MSGRSLTKTYEGKGDVSTPVLHGIDIDIYRSEMLAIMGPSGSGKTTLLNLLGGIDRPSSGTITLCNQKTTDMSEHKLALFRRKHLGFVFQDFNLLDGLTVRENIALPLILDHVSQPDIESRVAELVEPLGLTRLINRKPYQLSGGEQQRVAIARAIVNQPDVLLADEPTGNLDTVSSESVLNCLQALRSRDRAIVIITHSPLVASRCERVVFILDGVIKQILKNDSESQSFVDRLVGAATFNSTNATDI